MSVVPFSDATQDYLKTIYRLEKDSGGASPTRLAEELGVSLPSVTSMVKKLVARKLVSHAPYAPIALTRAGERQALEVVRHHRLLETFLAKMLGFGLESLHDEADRLEHAISAEFEEKIDRLLGRPSFDPHGAPIPDPEGRVTRRDLQPLTELPVGERAVVRRITSRDPAELRLFETIGLVPGAAVRVTGKVEGSGIVRILLAGREDIPVERVGGIAGSPLAPRGDTMKLRAVITALLASLVLAACARVATSPHAPAGYLPSHASMSGMSAAAEAAPFMPGVTADVNVAANGFDPGVILTDFDYGTVSVLPGGQRLREYWITAMTAEVEIAPGMMYEAWTYNGRVPGPTLRAVEGDRIRIHFSNGTPEPHTMHFHTVHPAGMDGVYEPVPAGGTFTYEFDAVPFGVHPYHCHVMPLASHISRGLYGVVVIDPRQGRPKADYEFVMVMSGNDVDFDNENDFYNVNFIPFTYDRHPIRIRKDALVRIYLVNMLEFDQSNSFHIHANFFDYYPTGTSLRPSEHTDTIAQMQGQRGILEFRYLYPGRYLFHAHKTEFAELGWTGVFEVEE